MNWGFTQPGLYSLAVAARITGPSGVLTSETYVYRVCVIGESGAAAATLQRVCGVSGGTSSAAAGPKVTGTPGVAGTPTVVGESISVFPHTWTPQTGHTDAFVFDPIATPGTLSLRIHSDALGVLKPNDTLFLANDTQYSSESPGRTKLSLPGPHPILGGAAGDPVWILPGDFTEYSPGYDRRLPEVTKANSWSAMTLILQAIDAPSPTARFAMWSPSGAVRFLTTGDTTTPQTWTIGDPAHGHMNWGFTEPGLYTLTIVARITGPSGVLTSEPYPYRVCVIGETGHALATLQRVCGVGTPPGTGTPTGSGTPVPTIARWFTPGPSSTATPSATSIPTGSPGDTESAVAPAGSNPVAITANIEPCGLGISVPAASTALSGGTLQGGVRTFSGTLPAITVISCQAGDWAVMGVASDFVASNGATISASRLGWVPTLNLEDRTGGMQAGAPISAGASPADGLGVSRVLGQAQNQGGVAGVASFGAVLTLEAPVSTPPGAYAATLTLSLIGN
jgi:surface-anchored protein